MANIVFDEQSAERIAKAVRWVEAQAIDESPDPQALPGDEAAPVTELVDVVTNVECVDNSLVITTETLLVIKQEP